MTGGAAEMFEAVLSEGGCCKAKTLSLVSSVGVRGGGAVCGESGRVIGEAREECLEVWCSVWWLGEGVLVGVGEDRVNRSRQLLREWEVRELRVRDRLERVVGCCDCFGCLRCCLVCLE